MPFRLKNVASPFQRAMDITPSLVKWKLTLEYQGDIFILSRSVEEHLEYLQTVLGLMSKASVSLKIKDFFFLNARIHY